VSSVCFGCGEHVAFCICDDSEIGDKLGAFAVFVFFIVIMALGGLAEWKNNESNSFTELKIMAIEGEIQGNEGILLDLKI